MDSHTRPTKWHSPLPPWLFLLGGGGVVPNMGRLSGSNVGLVKWGQDGIAMLTVHFLFPWKKL